MNAHGVFRGKDKVGSIYKGLDLVYRGLTFVKAIQGCQTAFAWIDTLVPADSNVEFEIKMMCPHFSNGLTNVYMFGSRIGYTNEISLSFGFNGSYLGFFNRTGSSYANNFVPPLLTPMVASFKDCGFYKDGVLFKSFNNNTFSVSGRTLTVFRGFATDYNDSYNQGVIYYLKIWYNKVLVRDFVPCLDAVNNLVGLYDLTGSLCPITNTPFYASQGTGTLSVYEY